MTVATALLSQSALRFVLLGAATGSLQRARRARHRARVPHVGRPELQRGCARRHRRLRLLRLPRRRHADRARRRARAPRRRRARSAHLRRDGVAPRRVAPRAAHRDARSLQRLRVVHGPALGSSTSRQPRSLLPSKNVTLFGDLVIGRDRLMLIGVALVCAVVLRVHLLGDAVRPRHLRGRREPPGRGERGLVARPHRDGELRRSRAGCRRSPRSSSRRSSR